MFGLILIWIIFCALCIPMLIQVSDRGYNIDIAQTEELLNADDYNPKWQSKLYEQNIARDKAAGALWMIAGFGTIYGFMFAAMRFASVGDQQDNLYEFFLHYTEVYEAHQEHICKDSKYCEICSGEWILDTE